MIATPELPDVIVYAERIRALAAGQRLSGMRISSPFVLRTVTPAPETFTGHTLVGTERVGKRIVLAFDGDLFAVFHLMIAGRLHWRKQLAAIPRGHGVLALDFETGSLVLTESSSKRRAALHLVAGRAGLRQFDRGGIDLTTATSDEVALALRRRSRTLKRALTDPTIVDGVGNAFSDEILHRAKLSPFALTGGLDDATTRRLHDAARDVLAEWVVRLRAQTGDGFPEKVTAFRPEMAVHGKYGEPCPVCGTPVQRIVYAENEANYCPVCQTEGRVLADRSLSRLLKDDWPRTIEDLERLPAAKESER